MEGFCRGCLIKYNEPMELLQYTEKNRRLFVYSTGLQVKRNDSFTFQLCKDCFLNMKQACKFKKLCRTSDKRFKNYLVLKDVGDQVDFCTFLKNNDDTLTFRLPMISGSSTPANQKCRDDDNESTCTSIRNFMTDILQGEEMPDTEAQIIREVIEEEADVLDDSLDSHWLQDDMSIDTDFRLDFSFSPFSTPHTVNNDRCYTPKKYVEQKEQENFYSINTEKQTKILNDFTNVFKNNQDDVKELQGFEEKKNCSIEKFENNAFKTIKEVESLFNTDKIVTYNTNTESLKLNQKFKELCNFRIDEIDGDVIGNTEKTIKQNQSLKELCNFDKTEIESIGQSESKTEKHNKHLKELCNFGIDEIGGIGQSESNTNKHTKSLKEFCNFGINEVDGIGQFESKTNKHTKSLKELSNFGIDEVDGIGQTESNTKKQNKSIKDLCDFSLYDIDSIEKPESNTIKNIKSLKELSDLSLQDFDDIGKSESSTFKNEHNVKELSAFGIEENDSIAKSDSNTDLPLLHVFDKDKLDAQNFSTPKDIGSVQSNNEMSNSSINIEALLKDKPCTIDRNLEEALNTDNKEFSLDDLLVSPRVLQGASAASTPTITNILFGEKLEIDANINPKIGQWQRQIEGYDNAQCDIEIFEEFFQNDTKEFDLEDIKRANVENKTKDTKEEFSNDIGEVDNKENDVKDIGMDISVDDKNQDHDINKSTTKKPEYKYINSTSGSEMFDLDNSYCNLCNKSFKSVKSLSIHFAKFHSIKIIKPYMKRKYPNYCKLCNLCGKKCKDIANFAKHVKVCGKPVEPFKCERCLAEFKSQSNLDRHIVSHGPKAHLKKNTGKEFVCNICGAIMNSSANFSLHLRRHSKSYSETCTECGKGFYRKSDLRAHMRHHTGDTPYSCSFCTRLFARKDVMIRHIRIHLDEKFYHCDYCGLRCTNKYQLRQHIQKRSCRKKEDKLPKQNKKMDIDTPNEEKVTVIYAKGDDIAIKKQLPFLETDMSN